MISVDTSRSDRRSASISVVVVSWNTRELALSCVRSILDHCGDDADVIVVDNASGDGTARALRERFPEIRVIENQRNLGAAAACNIGMSQARGDAIVLMQPDAYVCNDVILGMGEFMLRSPDVGMLGCELRFPDGRHQHTAQRRMSIGLRLVERLWLYKLISRKRAAYLLLGGYWPAEKAVDADWLAAIQMVRRAVFQRTGGMDERFFLGGEESEWASRVRRLGYRVVYRPDLGVIYHIGSASWNQVWTERGRLRRWHRLGVEAYAAEHGPAAAVAYRLAEILGLLVRVAVYRALDRIHPRVHYAAEAERHRMLLEFYLHPREREEDHQRIRA